jgi:hypothetical protein
MAHELPEKTRDPVRFRLDTVHNFACRNVVRIAHLGASGQITGKQAAGYAVGLKANLAILERTAPVAHGIGDSARPVKIEVNLGVAVNGQSAAGSRPPELWSGDLGIHPSRG